MARAIMMLYHDDFPCSAKLTKDGFCPECGFAPPLEDIDIRPCCVICKVLLSGNQCPNCERKFSIG